MAGRRRPKSAPKPQPKHSRKLKDVNLDYPNDKAFNLISAFFIFPAFAFVFNFFQSLRFTVNVTPTPPSPQIILALKASRYSHPYNLSMQYYGATVSERAVRRRVERFFERQEFENGVESGGGDVVSSPNYIVPSPSSTTHGDTEPFPDSSTTPPGDSVPSPDLSTTSPCDPTSKYSLIKKARKHAIDKLPYCMRKGKTSYAMTKRKKRTTF